MSSELVREYCAMSFPMQFPAHMSVSEKYRGKNVTVTFDGENFRVMGEQLTGFDADFARIYLRHSGSKDYYDQP